MIQRNQGTIPVGGITNPVYIIKAKMIIAEGHKACANVRDIAPKVRKRPDRANVVTKDMRRKMKKAAGVRRRLVKKYRTRLNDRQLKILNGRSQISEDIASVKGW